MKKYLALLLAITSCSVSAFTINFQFADDFNEFKMPMRQAMVGYISTNILNSKGDIETLEDSRVLYATSELMYYIKQMGIKTIPYATKNQPLVNNGKKRNQFIMRIAELDKRGGETREGYEVCNIWLPINTDAITLHIDKYGRCTAAI